MQALVDDISAELGNLTPNVTVWLRRPVCIGPRYLNDRSEVAQIGGNQARDFPANAFLEAATTNRMNPGQNVYAHGFFRRLLWHTAVLNSTLSRMCLDSTSGAFFTNDQATYVTKNQRMCEAFQERKMDIVTTPTISADGRTVEFQMPVGTVQHREFDAIVLCTGFRSHFPWLKLESFDPNPGSWWLHCFPERLGGSLFFVGYARPHQRGISGPRYYPATSAC